MSGRPHPEPTTRCAAGCDVRLLSSCNYVVGLCVFTGADTKIMRNQRPTPSKQVRAVVVQLGPASPKAPRWRAGLQLQACAPPAYATVPA